MSPNVLIKGDWNHCLSVSLLGYPNSRIIATAFTPYFRYDSIAFLFRSSLHIQNILS